MERELILAIPGPWKERSEFTTAVIAATDGQFMFAGPILMNPCTRDDITVEFCDADPQMKRAFQVAGRGQILPRTIGAIARHSGVAYAHFPLAVVGQQERLRKFTAVLRQAGGFAIKIESSGVAHEWDAWERLLTSPDLFDLYDGFVTLIGDEQHYYSCGMHHFDLPDTQVPRSLPDSDAARLMHQFNFYRISEAPSLEAGHTFSLSAESPRYALSRVDDGRYPADHLFHNPHGLWDLSE
jgi:hypothetical protein